MTAGRVKFRVVAGQSAPAALNPNPPFRAVLITAFVPVPVMAPVFVVTMKPDPAIVPYPMASGPEKVRAGRRGNFFSIWLGWPVLYDHLRGRSWRWRGRRCITLVRMTVLPAAFDPHIAVVTAIPVAWHPVGLGSRTAIPMASDPHPTVMVPCPVTIHPEKVRAGLRASIFISRRGWSFAYDDEAGHTNADG
jgi:hypothetical protein